MRQTKRLQGSGQHVVLAAHLDGDLLGFGNTVQLENAVLLGLQDEALPLAKDYLPKAALITQIELCFVGGSQARLAYNRLYFIDEASILYNGSGGFCLYWQQQEERRAAQAECRFPG